MRHRLGYSRKNQFEQRIGQDRSRGRRRSHAMKCFESEITDVKRWKDIEGSSLGDMRIHPYHFLHDDSEAVKKAATSVCLVW
jgi:hypothetical protein